MGFTNSFKRYMKFNVQFSKLTETKDPTSGTTTKSFTNVGDPVKAGYWIDSVVVTDVNDKFVDDEVGTIVIDPNKFKPEANAVYRVTKTDDSTINDVVGFDDLGNMGQVLLVKYRKSYG